MIRTFLFVSSALIAVLLFSATHAIAQPTQTSDADTTDGSKIQHVILDGDTLEGSALGSTGATYTARQGSDFGRQSNLTRSFGRELQNSLHDDAL